MAIIGAHALLYSHDADAVRDILRDVFELEHVDSGGGWLIFALPPAEMGVHPMMTPDAPTTHEMSFMCDDIQATMAELEARGVVFDGGPVDAGFGIAVTMLLPGDLRMQLYEPRHDTAI